VDVSAPHRRSGRARRTLVIVMEALLIAASLAGAGYLGWRAVDAGVTAPALPTVTASPGAASTP
jgi:hypothetical protein